MEDWSSAEAGLFEEAMQKYGKDFNDIKKDFLPWKSMKNIIEYFFMWKTTDRYVQQKRVKVNVSRVSNKSLCHLHLFERTEETDFRNPLKFATNFLTNYVLK